MTMTEGTSMACRFCGMTLKSRHLCRRCEHGIALWSQFAKAVAAAMRARWLLESARIIARKGPFVLGIRIGRTFQKGWSSVMTHERYEPGDIDLLVAAGVLVTQVRRGKSAMAAPRSTWRIPDWIVVTDPDAEEAQWRAHAWGTPVLVEPKSADPDDP